MTFLSVWLDNEKAFQWSPLTNTTMVSRGTSELQRPLSTSSKVVDRMSAACQPAPLPHPILLPLHKSELCFAAGTYTNPERVSPGGHWPPSRPLDGLRISGHAGHRCHPNAPYVDVDTGATDLFPHRRGHTFTPCMLFRQIHAWPDSIFTSHAWMASHFALEQPLPSLYGCSSRLGESTCRFSCTRESAAGGADATTTGERHSMCYSRTASNSAWAPVYPRRTKVAILALSFRCSQERLPAPNSNVSLNDLSQYYSAVDKSMNKTTEPSCCFTEKFPAHAQAWAKVRSAM